MFSDYSKRRERLPAFVLLCAAVILACFLLPEELSFRAPLQEYENNDIKDSRIIFSRPPGFYDDPFTLKIKAPTREIYYTLDGTDPVRGQEGTYRYSGGISITDATEQPNIHSQRRDVTTRFDTEAVEAYGTDERDLDYRVPDEPVDKATILRAAFYSKNGERSEIQTGAYFIGYKGRQGYGTAKVLSIVTDPENLFGYENGIYVTGAAYDRFKEADSFNDSSIWYRHVWWWWDANYHNGGRDWERTANVQFFDEEGSLLLQQQAGIRIQGGGSRGFLPKSLNLYARRDYDGNTKFHYDFFGTGYLPKRLTLTCGGDDCYTKQKDRLVSELAADMGFSTMHYEPCLLFLDGEFWGFYFLTEKYDEKYFSYYYTVPEEEVLEIKNNELEVGNRDDLKLYQEMKTFIEENDMSVEDNYEKACSLMDMDSFINYCAVQIYCARCGDWPSGNFALWRTRPAPETEESGEDAKETQAAPEGSDRGEDDREDYLEDDRDEIDKATRKAYEESPYRDGRWRWILFDVNSAAISTNLQDHDTLNYVISSKKNKLFASLSRNQDFRERFSERILELGQTIFTPDSVNEKTDLYMEEMSDPMDIHYRRFFGADSGLDFRKITQSEIRDFFEVRYDVVKKMLEDNFGD